MNSLALCFGHVDSLYKPYFLTILIFGTWIIKAHTIVLIFFSLVLCFQECKISIAILCKEYFYIYFLWKFWKNRNEAGVFFPCYITNFIWTEFFCSINLHLLLPTSVHPFTTRDLNNGLLVFPEIHAFFISNAFFNSASVLLNFFLNSVSGVS